MLQHKQTINQLVNLLLRSSHLQNPNQTGLPDTPHNLFSPLLCCKLTRSLRPHETPPPSNHQVIDGIPGWHETPLRAQNRARTLFGPPQWPYYTCQSPPRFCREISESHRYNTLHVICLFHFDVTHAHNCQSHVQSSHRDHRLGTWRAPASHPAYHAGHTHSHHLPTRNNPTTGQKPPV